MDSYSAADVVQLPRFGATGAMALGEQMLSAGKHHKKKLPKTILKALTALDGAHSALTHAIRDQVAPAQAGGADPVKLDRNLDACWSGFNDWCTGLSKLPDELEAVEARELQSTILPDGLKFILLPYELEWAESETRLQRIETNKLDVRIKALGGGLFLSAIQKAHKAYGLALGMTAPLAKDGNPAPSIREALDRFSAALRTYVVKVIGSVEDDEPETAALADDLLAPLTT